MENRIKPRPSTWYIRSYVVGWTISYILILVYSAYLERDGLIKILSFYPTDGPGNVSASCLPKPIGNHFFGDFVSAVCHAKLPSPYLSPFATNYFPVSYVVMKPFAVIYDRSLILAISSLVLVGFCLIALPIWKALRPKLMEESLTFVVLAVVLSQPFLSALDRGNIQLIVTGFVIYGFSKLDSNRSSISPVMLGLAAAMKAYPVVFILIFVRRREWRRLALATSVGLVTTFLSLVSFAGSFSENFKEMFSKVLVFREGETMWLRYNSSLKALVLSGATSQNRFISATSLFLNQNYSAIALVLLVVLVVAILYFKMEMFDFAILGTLFCTLFIELTAAYVLTLFALAFLYIDNLETLDKLRKFQLLMLALIMIPKGISIDSKFSDHGPSLTSLLNPLAMLSLYGTVMFCCLRKTFQGRSMESASGDTSVS